MSDTRTSWPPDVRARAVQLHIDHGPREAARMMAAEGHPVPLSTISSWAARGPVPQRTHTIANTQAAAVKQLATMAQRRAALADRMLAEAEACMDEMAAPCLQHHWVPSGHLVSEEIGRPTFQDRKALATIAAILVDKSQLLAGEATGRVEGLLPKDPEVLRSEMRAKVAQLRPVAS